MFGKKKEKAEKTRKEGYVGAKKFWAWQSREVSDAAFIFLMNYVVFYCTDVMVVNPLIVGTLFALSKVIDAITDIVAGYIVDNTNSKWGRGRPYDLCLIGAWASVVLLFACPDGFSEGLKIAWIVFWYIMANAVFYTFLNAGEKVFMLRAFDYQQVVKLTSMGGIATSLLGIFCGIFVPQAINWAGKDPSSWIIVALVCGIVFTVIGLARFVFVREREDLVNMSGNTKKEKQKLDLKEIFQMLSKNHQWLLFCVITLLGTVVSSLGVQVYYFEKILGNLGLQSIFAGASALAVFALVLLPKLMRRYRMQQILLAGQIIAAVSYTVCFIFYNNIPVLVVGYVICMFATVPGTYAVNLILYDNAIYNQYQGMRRMEGTMGSVNGFVKRAGGALGTFLLGIALTIIQYDANVVTLAPITFWGLRFMMYGLPAVVCVITAILWSRYTLEKRLPQMKEELKERDMETEQNSKKD